MLWKIWIAWYCLRVEQLIRFGERKEHGEDGRRHSWIRASRIDVCFMAGSERRQSYDPGEKARSTSKRPSGWFGTTDS